MADPSSMEGAYGKSRGELLQWLNRVLPTELQQHIGDIAKVEQCGSGIPYVFLLPRLFPHSVSAQAAPSKVKFPARQEYEAASNLKLVQEVFSKNQVSRNMEIDKMAKRNFQANLEFLQWFKRLYDNSSAVMSSNSGDGESGADQIMHEGGAGVSGRATTTTTAALGVRRLGGVGQSPGSSSSPASRKPSTGAGATGAVRSLFGGSALRTTPPGAAVGSTPPSRPLSAVSSTRDGPRATVGSSSLSGSSRGIARAAGGGSSASASGRVLSPTRRSKSPVGPAAVSSGRSGSATRSLTPGGSSRLASGGSSRGFTPPPGTAASRTSVGSMDPVGYVELERRFYYDKLRRIEELVRQPAGEGNELAVVIQKLLFAAH